MLIAFELEASLESRTVKTHSAQHKLQWNISESVSQRSRRNRGLTRPSGLPLAAKVMWLFAYAAEGLHDLCYYYYRLCKYSTHSTSPAPWDAITSHDLLCRHCCSWFVSMLLTAGPITSTWIAISRELAIDCGFVFQHWNNKYIENGFTENKHEQTKRKRRACSYCLLTSTLK